MHTRMRTDRLRWLPAALLVATQSVAAAQLPVLGAEDIQLSADTMESDTRNDEHVLKGNVRIAQGDLSIEAEQVTLKGLQTDHAQLQLERNVHIRSAEADLRANSAHAAFADGRFATATVQGSPATFVQLNAKTPDKPLRGSAQTIEYDISKDMATLTQDVRITDGDNAFRTDKVVYHLKEGRLDSDGGRVNITIKPGTIKPGTLKPDSVPALPGSQDKKAPEQGGNP